MRWEGRKDFWLPRFQEALWGCCVEDRRDGKEAPGGQGAREEADVLSGGRDGGSEGKEEGARWRATAEVKAERLYGSRRWGELERELGGRGQGVKGALSAQRRCPTQVSEHPDRRHMRIPAKERHLRPEDPIWLTEILLSCRFGPIPLFLK